MLIVAVASIEIGLAFAVGIGVGISLRDDRWSRIWVAAAPIVLYLIWSVWARQYEQDTIDPVAAVRAIASIPASLSIALGALLGLTDPSAGASPNKLGSLFEARLVAVLAAVLFVRRIARGAISNEAWILIATLAAFWLLVTIGARPPDQSRFVFTSATLVLLVCAALLDGKRFRGWRFAVVWVFVALALPTNLSKLAEGREYLVDDARATRAEYAIFDLVGDQVDPDVQPSGDARVSHYTVVPFTGLTAGQYLPAADRFGRLGFSVHELAEQNKATRAGADAGLIGALELAVAPGSPPAAGTSCQRLAGTPEAPALTTLAAGSTLLRATGQDPVRIGLSRFSDLPGGVPMGRLGRGWSTLEIPVDRPSRPIRGVCTPAVPSRSAPCPIRVRVPMDDDREALRLTPGLERALLIGVFAWVAVIVLASWWGLTFVKDDWAFLLERRGSFGTAIGEPYNEHIVVGLSVIYRGLVAVAGLNPVPFRILLTTAFLASGLLVFIYVRRRVGVALGLLATAITLAMGMGSAYQDLLWPVQIGLMVSFGCGLAALILLEREQPRTDIAAAVLLVLATLTYTVGLAFLAGAAVSVVLSERSKSRAWIVAPAAIMFLAWWIAWGSSSDSAITASNVLSAPVYVFDGFAVSFAGLLGMDNPQNGPIIPAIEWGRVIAAVAGVAALIRIAQMRRLPRSFFVILAAAVAYWVIVACFETPEREPATSRMVFAGGVFVLLLASELLAGVRIRRVTAFILIGLGVAALASNADHFGHASNRFARAADREEGGLTAIELAREHVSPGFALTRPMIGTGFAPVSAGPYLDAVDDYGNSPALTEAQLARASQAAKTAADRTFRAAYGIHLEPRSAPTAACRRLEATGNPATVEVPPEGLEITAARGGEFAGVRVGIARFARGFSITVGRVPAGETAVLAIPADDAARPWRVELTPAPARVCVPVDS